MTDSIDEELAGLVSGRPDLLADPYPLYRRLREETPVRRVPGGAIVSRYNDVHTALLDSRVFPKTVEMSHIPPIRAAQLSEIDRRLLDEIYAFWDVWLTNCPDGDGHDRIRNMVYRAFTPNAMTQLRPRVTDIVQDLLKDPLSHGQMELVHDFSFQLPLRVISELVDVPVEDREQIRQWSNDFAGFVAGGALDVPHNHRAMVALKGYLTELVQRRKEAGTSSPLLQLLLEADASGVLIGDELTALMANLVFGGHETTTNLVGNGLLALLRQRDQWELLVGDLSLIPSAVAEIFRYDSSVQWHGRIAAFDTEIGGVPISRGELVQFFVGAANRDPDAYSDPDRFDVTRQGKKHLSLGLGPRYCLGAALATMETEVALASILDSAPKTTLGERPPVWRPNWVLRGLEYLHLNLA